MMQMEIIFGQEMLVVLVLIMGAVLGLTQQIEFTSQVFSKEQLTLIRV